MDGKIKVEAGMLSHQWKCNVYVLQKKLGYVYRTDTSGVPSIAQLASNDKPTFVMVYKSGTSQGYSYDYEEGKKPKKTKDEYSVKKSGNTSKRKDAAEEKVS